MVVGLEGVEHSGCGREAWESGRPEVPNSIGFGAPLMSRRSLPVVRTSNLCAIDTAFETTWSRWTR